MIIDRKGINSSLSIPPKQFSKLIPTNLKFPVIGNFKFHGFGIKLFKLPTNLKSGLSKKVSWNNVERLELIESFTINRSEFVDYYLVQKEKIIKNL